MNGVTKIIEYIMYIFDDSIKSKIFVSKTLRNFIFLNIFCQFFFILLYSFSFRGIYVSATTIVVIACCERGGNMKSVHVPTTLVPTVGWQPSERRTSVCSALNVLFYWQRALLAGCCQTDFG